MRTSPSSAQSSRDRPPADVSPDTPALTTSKFKPVTLQTLLQQRRVRRALRQPEAGGEAVAEHDNARTGSAAGFAGVDSRRRSRGRASSRSSEREPQAIASGSASDRDGQTEARDASATSDLSSSRAALQRGDRLLQHAFGAPASARRPDRRGRARARARSSRVVVRLALLGGERAAERSSRARPPPAGTRRPCFRILAPYSQLFYRDACSTCPPTRCPHSHDKPALSRPARSGTRCQAASDGCRARRSAASGGATRRCGAPTRPSRKIANRLGWMTSPLLMADSVRRLLDVRGPRQARRLHRRRAARAWADRAWRRKSCAAVLGVAPGWPRLHMLDSTDPAAVPRRRHAARARRCICSPASRGRRSSRTRWPRISASGSRTPASPRWADHFVAITDAGTELDRARARGSASATSSSTRPTSAAAIPRCRSSAWCRRR